MRADVIVVRSAICEATAAVCAGVFGARLRALVLTGSLARDEATLLRESNGWRLLGDADFLLVFDKPGAEAPALNRLAAGVEARLRGEGIVAHVGFGAVNESYFRALPPSSFTYELKACGQVIAGDRTLLDRIPDYRPEQLSREDAWRTVSNRMIELLSCFEGVGFPIDRVSPELEYAGVKLCLDLATSYLIFAGGYEPTYRGRSRRLRALAESLAAAPFPLRAFSDQVAQSTAWKFAGPQDHERTNWDFLAKTMDYARRLWRWEALQLAASQEPAPAFALLRRLARNQTLIQRVRGWLSLARRAGWGQSWRSWPRWAWLSRMATPRYLIYYVAEELFCRLPALVQPGREDLELQANWRQWQKLLPLVSPAPPSAGWRQLIGDINWNYNRFLLETRA